MPWGDSYHDYPEYRDEFDQVGPLPATARQRSCPRGTVRRPRDARIDARRRDHPDGHPEVHDAQGAPRSAAKSDPGLALPGTERRAAATGAGARAAVFRSLSPTQVIVNFAQRNLFSA